MFLPYLRGRQFELLAIRELLEYALIGPNVLPIIEPVKLSSTLLKTLEFFQSMQREVAVIHNPQVGSFMNDLREQSGASMRSRYVKLLREPLLVKTHLVNKRSEYELRDLFELEGNRSDVILVTASRNSLEHYPDEFLKSPPRFNLVLDESMFRRKVRKNRVLLEDRFEKQVRNADYVNLEDEFFSDAHLYYADDGFVGFSDYSIVGEQFSEAGFAPLAVAIHIVYFDEEYNLRVRHFLSDSNDDIRDPAGKFYQAVEKVVQWNEHMKLDTRAMKIFEEHYRGETYPGLGTVKKLSLMHHIELISKYLDGVHNHDMLY